MCACEGEAWRGQDAAGRQEAGTYTDSHCVRAGDRRRCQSSTKGALVSSLLVNSEPYEDLDAQDLQCAPLLEHGMNSGLKPELSGEASPLAAVIAASVGYAYRRRPSQESVRLEGPGGPGLASRF